MTPEELRSQIKSDRALRRASHQVQRRGYAVISVGGAVFKIKPWVRYPVRNEGDDK